MHFGTADAFIQSDLQSIRCSLIKKIHDVGIAGAMWTTEAYQNS